MRKGEAMDRNLFVLSATQQLCSSLDPESSLKRFYAFVRTRLPVREFDLSKTRMPFQETIRIARVTDEGVACPWEQVPVPVLQRIMGTELLASSAEAIRRCMIVREDDVLYRYLRQAPGTTLRPPLFFMRLERDGQIIGSAIFQTSRVLTDSEQALLRGLEAPLCMALQNMLQFHELARLKEQLMQDNERLRRKLCGLMEVDVIGAKAGLREVMKKVSMAAPVDVPVLITGETGSGKEIIAKAVHDMSSRRDKPFVAVNCGALPPALVDSELFGHVKGAFTGAITGHKGRFERADGGTLFLDEVGELPLETQARLLRVLETREVERVGGSSPLTVNIRVVAATHRDLPRMVKNGEFREDLYYRLRVVSIHVPPLRERRRDIPLLVNFLLRRSAARYGVLAPPLAEGEMERLLHHDWPGNVRELQNVLEEALVCADGRPLRFSLGVPGDERDRAVSRSAAAVLPDMDGAMREYLLTCLRATHGRVDGPRGAARVAGLTPSTFRFRCKKLGIAPRQVG